MLEAGLYLIPCPLSDGALDRILPAHNIEIVSGIRFFVVESLRSARRFLKKCNRAIDIDSLTMNELNEHTDLKDIASIEALLEPIGRGEPVGVISVIAQQTQAYQLMGYLNMLIVISINLGLVNLLPIPGLDGCRILFVLFEIIFRRPVNRRVEAYIHLAGYAFLMCVMLYFTFHDVLNIFG